MIRKDTQIEMSKTVVAVTIASVFSIFSLSLASVFTTTKTINQNYEEQMDVLAEETETYQNITAGLENMSGIVGHSTTRIEKMKETIPLTQDTLFGREEINNFLKLSSMSRLAITEDKSVVDAQTDAADVSIDGKAVKAVLHELLEDEELVWISLDNYLLKMSPDDWKKNELLFKQIDYSLLDHYEKVNAYQNLLEKAMNSQTTAERHLQRRHERFDGMQEDLLLTRSMSYAGLAISTILLFFLGRMTFRHTLRKK